MRIRAITGRVALTVASLLVTVVLAGCGEGSFDSSDWAMELMTSKPPTEQVLNAAGYVEAPDSKAVMLGKRDAFIRQGQEETREQAMEAYGSGDLDIAASLLDELIPQRRNDMGLRRDRAAVAVAAWDADEALIQFEAQDKIARDHGWDQTFTYWDDLIADTRQLNTDVYREQGWQLVDEPIVEACEVRLADVLDGKADYMESIAGDPGEIAALRKEASTYRPIP